MNTAEKILTGREPVTINVDLQEITSHLSLPHALCIG